MELAKQKKTIQGRNNKIKEIGRIIGYCRKYEKKNLKEKSVSFNILF